MPHWLQAGPRMQELPFMMPPQPPFIPRILCFLILILFSSTVIAQEDTLRIEYDSPPEPIGGYAAIQRGIIYPEWARETGQGGVVIVQCLILKDGTTGPMQILQSAPGFDQAAMDALADIKWIPARKGKEPVTVRISVPVVFRLKDTASSRHYPRYDPVILEGRTPKGLLKNILVVLAIFGVVYVLRSG